MTARISIIICTHNPRMDYLERTLDALRVQTLPFAEWEFLVVDNASSKPVASMIDLSWHPRARIIVESTLGVTSARLRGIAETSSEFIVFCDDDTPFAADFLETTKRIASENSRLGAWGCQCLPEFEVEPTEEAKPCLHYFALRTLTEDKWSNYSHENLPTTGGMTIRRQVAEQYAEHVKSDVRRRRLGRTGKSLSSSEDLDMALTCYELGFGTGLFKKLVITHLISAPRLEMAYLDRLTENIAYSQAMLNYLRYGITGEDKRPWRRRFFDGTIAWLERTLREPGQRRYLRNHRHGELRAKNDILNMGTEKQN